MAIIGIDAQQPMLLGANEMQRIRGTHRDTFFQRKKGYRRIPGQTIRHRKPGPQTRGAIFRELGGDLMKRLFSESTLAPLAMKNTRHFHASKRTTVHAPERLRQLPHGITFRLIHIKLGDIGRVEIAHARSRFSETACALSVPHLSVPSNCA